MTTTVDTGHIGATYYSAEEASAYYAERCLDHDNRRDSACVNSHNLDEIKFLIPAMDALAADHGQRLILGSYPHLPVALPWLWSTAGITEDTELVLVAHNAVLAPGTRGPTNDDVENVNHCIRGCHPQLDVHNTIDDPTPYPNWYLDGTEHPIGSVSYRVIVMPFWWHASSTSQGRLDQFRASFERALLMALDREQHRDAIDQVRNELRNGIADMLMARSSNNIQALRNEVPHLVESNTEHERTISTNTRRLDEIRVQLNALEDAQLNEDELKAKVQVELDQLEANETVASTALDGPNVEVTTKPLTMSTPDGESALAGEFKVRINFTDHTLSVHNMTRRLGSYDHPHVSDGAFCTGDQRMIINQLMTRGEIAATMSVIVDLLQHVNPDDTYTSEWRAWFDLEED